MNEEITYADRIDDVLCRLHLDKNKRGYHYLKDVIEIMHTAYKKEVCEAMRIVGRRYGVTYKTVDSAISRCVKDGIIKCPSQDKIEVFGYDVGSNHRGKRNYYTNNEFIMYIMNYIHKHEKD